MSSIRSASSSTSQRVSASLTSPVAHQVDRAGPGVAIRMSTPGHHPLDLVVPGDAAEHQRRGEMQAARPVRGSSPRSAPRVRVSAPAPARGPSSAAAWCRGRRSLPGSAARTPPSCPSRSGRRRACRVRRAGPGLPRLDRRRHGVAGIGDRLEQRAADAERGKVAGGESGNIRQNSIFFRAALKPPLIIPRCASCGLDVLVKRRGEPPLTESSRGCAVVPRASCPRACSAVCRLLYGEGDATIAHRGEAGMSGPCAACRPYGPSLPKTQAALRSQGGLGCLSSAALRRVLRAW